MYEFDRELGFDLYESDREFDREFVRDDVLERGWMKYMLNKGNVVNKVPSGRVKEKRRLERVDINPSSTPGKRKGKRRGERRGPVVGDWAWFVDGVDIAQPILGRTPS